MLLKIILFYFVFFFLPYPVFRKHFPDWHISLSIFFAVAFSYTAIWGFFLISYFFKLSNNQVLWIVVFLLFLGLKYSSMLCKNFWKSQYLKSRRLKVKYFFYILLLLIIWLPLLRISGEIFVDWDAVFSWNRWASNFYENIYRRYDTAYPVLYPALWSLIYKIQGTSDITFFARFSLNIFPIVLSLAVIQLYRETKDVSFLWILALSFIVIFAIHDINNGYMDAPSAVVGLMGLIAIYKFEVGIKNQDDLSQLYFFVALLFFGISALIKQAGLLFLLFGFLYCLIRIKSFEKKQYLFFFACFSVSYLLSFLILMHSIDALWSGNTNYLIQLTDSIKKDNFIDIWHLFIRWTEYHFLSSLSKYYIVQYTYIIILIGLLFSLFSKKYKAFIYLLVCLSIIYGTVWFQFFSYDSRNVWPLKSFLIILSSIGLGLVTNYLLKKQSLYFNEFSNVKTDKLRVSLYNFLNKNVNLDSLLYTLFLFMVLNFNKAFIENRWIYDLQHQQDKKIGDVVLAKKVANLLQSSSECVIALHNKPYVTRNYYLKKFHQQGRLYGDSNFNAKRFLNDFNKKYNCGRYWILGNWTKNGSSEENWESIKKLEKNKKITRIDSQYDIFYVPPKKN